MEDQINLLLTMPFPEKLVERIRNTSPRLNVTQQPAQSPEVIPEKLWKKVEVLYTNYILPTPEQAPNLRWIQFHWAGIDKLVDSPILEKEDLVATTLSGANASQVAEYVIAMMLALGHRLPDLHSHQQRSEWPTDRWKRFTPVELRGSTVGIVGYGSIGRQVARLLKPFGAQVLASKRNVMKPEDSGYIPQEMGDPDGKFTRRIYPAQAIKSMFKECDFVIIAVPLTPENKNLIGAEELESLKPSAYLIDVSRGGIVVHQALINAIKKGKVAGAALDVFPEEPLPEDSPLWELPNVIVTPHISGVTPHYDERAIDLFIANLQRYLNNELPLNQIDLERGY